jgi:hypothetical protein
MLSVLVNSSHKLQGTQACYPLSVKAQLGMNDQNFELTIETRQ